MLSQKKFVVSISGIFGDSRIVLLEVNMDPAIKSKIEWAVTYANSFFYYVMWNFVFKFFILLDKFPENFDRSSFAHFMSIINDRCHNKHYKCPVKI